jgi:hypothetical protein
MQVISCFFFSFFVNFFKFVFELGCLFYYHIIKSIRIIESSKVNDFSLIFFLLKKKTLSLSKHPLFMLEKIWSDPQCSTGHQFRFTRVIFLFFY